VVIRRLQRWRLRWRMDRGEGIALLLLAVVLL
jgi:hypothetical protein